MAANSKIEWTHHTFNPWEGCTKVSAGCQNCYAESRADRFGSVVWGPNGTRRVASESYWRGPLKWDREAKAAGERRRVFCASLADVFEDWQKPMSASDGAALQECAECGAWRTMEQMCHGPNAHMALTMADVRARLFRLIDATPNLDWLLLTKRPENVARMMPKYFVEVPEPCRDFSHFGRPFKNCPACNASTPPKFRPNVWLGTSVENQAAADERIPHLLNVPAAVRFLSCEPLLGPVDLSEVPVGMLGPLRPGASHDAGPRIDWVIVGGESGREARPMHPEWALSLRDQCQAAGVAFHFKQWGEWKPYRSMSEAESEALYEPIPDGHPEDLTRKCKVPNVMFTPYPMPRGGACDLMFKLGKKLAGRTIGGRTWDELPTVKVGAS